MLTIRAMSDGKGYSSNHLEHSDYYSDKQLLGESLACSAARRSASELARKASPEYSRGIHRGLAAARRMAMRAAQYVSFMLRGHSPHPITKNEPRMERENDHDFSL
jgi:hypothetical protein